jgi:hypothetical protein
MNRLPSNTLRNQRGWVLIASLVLSAIAASITVTWARHAVLAKGRLEMETGASEVEEEARSGLERTRERMRRGDPPGPTGDEDVVTAPNGDTISCSRDTEGHDRRRLKTHAKRPSGGDEEQASVRARAKIQPGCLGAGENPNGKRTRLTADAGGQVFMAGNLTILSSDATYVDQELAGLFLLEDGVDLTLNNVILRGAIITRPAAAPDHPLSSGANRPTVNLEGNVRLIAGTELPGVSIAGPDAVVSTSAGSRCEIEGFVVADELDCSNGRTTLQQMVVAETSESFGSDCRRPRQGREPRSWPDSIEAGAEEVTGLSFPATEFSEAELAILDAFDPSDL